MKKSADKNVNKLYGGIRERYSDARANGYRLHSYFLREQEILTSEIGDSPGVVLDIGSGSGLMAIPILNKASFILGLEFNEEACQEAKFNGLAAIRGNAFLTPLASESINNIYCCQFLNQQAHENSKLLLSECHRILLPQGKLVLIWRNGEALIHRAAHALFKLWDKIIGRPSFPMVNHSISDIESFAHSIGFKTEKKETIFPLLRWRSNKTNSLYSRIIGASYFLVLKRN